MRVFLSTAPVHLTGARVASPGDCRESQRETGPTRGVVSGGRFCRRTQGFTLLEILLALGLLALMASVLIGGTARVLANKPVSADEVFWQASAEARKLALQTGREARLGFAADSEHGKRFTLDDGATRREFPVTLAKDLQVNFMPGQKTAGTAIVLAGQVVETDSIPFVTYYPDGTCMAFRVQIRVGVSTHILSIDPWTCAPVLPEEK
jgi:prepilin-type N-terminal cleavage/methylation domain-containing protein